MARALDFVITSIFILVGFFILPQLSVFKLVVIPVLVFMALTVLLVLFARKVGRLPLLNKVRVLESSLRAVAFFARSQAYFGAFAISDGLGLDASGYCSVARGSSHRNPTAVLDDEHHPCRYDTLLRGYSGRTQCHRHIRIRYCLHIGVILCQQVRCALLRPARSRAGYDSSQHYRNHDYIKGVEDIPPDHKSSRCCTKAAVTPAQGPRDPAGRGYKCGNRLRRIRESVG